MPGARDTGPVAPPRGRVHWCWPVLQLKGADRGPSLRIGVSYPHQGPQGLGTREYMEGT